MTIRLKAPISDLLTNASSDAELDTIWTAVQATRTRARTGWVVGGVAVAVAAGLVAVVALRWEGFGVWQPSERSTPHQALDRETAGSPLRPVNPGDARPVPREHTDHTHPSTTAELPAAGPPAVETPAPEVKLPIVEAPQMDRPRSGGSDRPHPAPDEVGALLDLADAARRRGSIREAIAPLREIIDSFPKDARAGLAALTLGRMLIDTLDQPKRAAKVLKRAVELGLPRGLDDEATALRVEALDAAGNSTAAREAAAEYLKTFPQGRHRAAMMSAL